MLVRCYRLLALPLVLLICCGLRAEQVAKLPAPSNYVSDFAHVLSPQVTDQTNALCQQLQQQAAMLSYIDIIRFFAFAALCMVPLPFIMRKSRGGAAMH